MSSKSISREKAAANLIVSTAKATAKALEASIHSSINVTLVKIQQDAAAHAKSDIEYFDKFEKYMLSQQDRDIKSKDSLDEHIKDQNEKWARIEPSIKFIEGGGFTIKAFGWIIGIIGTIVAIMYGWSHR